MLGAMTTKHLLPISAAAILALLFIPAAGLAQSILLSAGNFTALGGTAITSTGTVGTIIRNGNVGLAPGATTGITGFPPAVVVNGAIIATGAVTSQARLDLITASVGLAGMPSNANMSNVDLGGKTLSAGVYTFNGAASQNGALVLDAQGQNNVAWVFQIGTALTTSINSTITFINLGSNGGSDLGVFWNAGSAITIGANNQIAGNYLAGTSVVLGSLDAGGGRTLALAGVSFDNDQINARGGPAGGDLSGGLHYNALGAVVRNGGSGGVVTIAPGALEGGIGTIGNNVTNSGILSPGVNTPGASTGALTVANNFSQSATGILVIQIASGTAFDQLLVTGTATLAGTLQVDLLNGFNPIGFSFPVLVAGGGVSGTFGTVNGSAFATNRAAVAGTVTYGPTAVTVAFVQLPFTGFAATNNQRAVAVAAQASPALTVALDNVPLAAQFPAALNALSPQGYQVWSEFAFAQSSALSARLARDDGMFPVRNDFYFDASQRRTRVRGDADVGSTVFTNTAGLIGGNRDLNPNFTLGGFFDYSETIAGLGAPDSRTTMKQKMPGVRAAWSDGPQFAHAVFAYGFDNYTSTRPVNFAGTSAIASSSTTGREWFADIAVGQRFGTGAVKYSPFAGVLLSHWSTNGFTETGAGAFNLTVADQSARSLRSQLGLEVQGGFGILRPHVRAAWLHEFSNDSRAISAAFGSTGFSVATRGPERNTALLGAGLDFVLGPAALLYTEVTAQTGGNVKLLSEWRVGVSVRF
ncbi:MAG: autotransporter [Lacunisphaera sp.]|nr:autotransporter [Lacunisphaera sp.]